jgi:hypothetical protein
MGLLSGTKLEILEENLTHRQAEEVKKRGSNHLIFVKKGYLNTRV